MKHHCAPEQVIVKLSSFKYRALERTRTGEFARDYLTDYVARPISFASQLIIPELIRLISLAVLTENLSGRRNLALRTEGRGGGSGGAPGTCSQVTN